MSLLELYQLHTLFPYPSSWFNVSGPSVEVYELLPGFPDKDSANQTAQPYIWISGCGRSNKLHRTSLTTPYKVPPTDSVVQVYMVTVFLRLFIKPLIVCLFLTYAIAFNTLPLLLMRWPWQRLQTSDMVSLHYVLLIRYCV